MIIFVPVDPEIKKVIVYLQHPHNHPAHPTVKPSAKDKALLARAIEEAGSFSLTTHKLIHGSFPLV